MESVNIYVIAEGGNLQQDHFHGTGSQVILNIDYTGPLVISMQDLYRAKDLFEVLI